MRRDGETGAALLSVLMIVAVMAVIAVLALDRLKLATLTARNAEAIAQVRADASGIETTALAAIDGLAETGADAARASWQGRVITLPVTGGLATARVADGGNCFNLNSVVREDLGDGGRQSSERSVSTSGRAQFVALMRLLEIPEGDATRIADATVDWIDADSVPLGLGAEDGAYAGAPVPYRAANALMVEPSELRAVAGVTPALYARLRPWLCTLPQAELSPINVNTLTLAQAPLLAMLLPGATDASLAQSAIAARPAGGWPSVDAFWRTGALADRQASIEVTSQPTTRTRWYTLAIAVEGRGGRLDETVLIDAGRVPARIVQRRWGDE